MSSSAEINLESDQRAHEATFEKHELRPAGGGRVMVYCGYRRCRDFDATNSKGQDYYSVRAGDGYVVGVVADGVSQSFFGDLAAKAVGQFLVDFLWRSRGEAISAEKLESELRGLERDVNAEVRAKELNHQPPMLAKALEATRAKGSQTVFTAFSLDLRGGEVVLYQVGDVSAWLYNRQGGWDQRSANQSGRWSSAGQSTLGLERSVAQELTGLLVHSDGVREAWARGTRRPEVSREDFIEEAREREKIDDLAFIAVDLGAAQYGTVRGDLRVSPPTSGRGPLRGETGQEAVDGPVLKRVSEPNVTSRPWFYHLTFFVPMLVMVFALGVLAGKRLVQPPKQGRSPSGTSSTTMSAGSPTVNSTAAQLSSGVPKSRPRSNSPAATPRVVESLTIGDYEIGRRQFVDAYRKELPAAIEGSPKPGEVTIRLSLAGTGVQSVAIKGPRDKSAKPVPETPGTGAVYARIQGERDGPTEITVELVTSEGRVQKRLQLLGRQQFLGYHKLAVGASTVKGNGS